MSRVAGRRAGMRCFSAATSLVRGLAAAACFGLAVAPAVRADGIAPGGLRGLLRTSSAESPGRGALSAGVFTSWHRVATMVDSTAGHAYVGITELQLGYGFADQMELGLALPIRSWFASSDIADRLEPSSQLGFGDLRLAAKLALPLPWQRLRLGMRGASSFATGSDSKGMSSGSTDLDLGGLLTLDLTRLESFVPTRLHADIAYRWNRNETRSVGLAPFSDITSGGFWPPSYPAVPPGEAAEWNDQILYRGAVEFETRKLTLFTEWSYDQSPRIQGLDLLDQPMFVTPGAILKLSSGIDILGAVDISLQNDNPPPTMPRLPAWRFNLSVVWRTALGLGDADRDGIPDKRDACPDKSEDFDGFEDQDGCPDLDNDFDGIPDERDLAPDLKEDFDGFEDQDGRPDMDNDGDGIRDADDACPNEPEDYDGDRDTDGCPDQDAVPQPQPQGQAPKSEQTPPGQQPPAPPPVPGEQPPPPEQSPPVPPGEPTPKPPAEPSPSKPPLDAGRAVLLDGGGMLSFDQRTLQGGLP